jgi:hypothetical protein
MSELGQNGSHGLAAGRLLYPGERTSSARAWVRRRRNPPTRLGRCDGFRFALPILRAALPCVPASRRTSRDVAMTQPLIWSSNRSYLCNGDARDGE